MGTRDSNERKFVGMTDQMENILDSIARAVVGFGLLGLLGGLVFLVLAYTNSGSGDAAALKLASQNLELYQKAGLFGMCFTGLGLTWLMWGEETSGPILLVAGLALVFSPAYLPAALGSKTGQLAVDTLNSITVIGYPAVVIGFLLIVVNVVMAARTKARFGAKADTLRYGQGVKEEKDRQNVFMGKCWQLPYCRKFVREKCPIYHSRRTCWKERVGCMCEESVISDAMAGKVIPADIVAAAKYIPKNSRLSPAQKFERCKVCTIYNEHQKHKYQIALPVTTLAVAATYILTREAAAAGIKRGLMNTDRFLSKAAFSGDHTNDPPPTLNGHVGTKVESDTKTTGVEGGFIPYHEIMLFVGVLVFLAYCVKGLEYVIFKLKL